ncbi:unnamed protein product [Mytilus edulis]|uniref:Endonuclease/exonuclease/phosphatase domain-containing protein n=1 Tax=Mytilus edulis TaxID=6550 RepID=A0A8S3U5V1_MYTED|nr:unnamed protein product [Mytilus edulis]
MTIIFGERIEIRTGGGLVAYARSDLVCDRKCNLEFNSVESICVDLFVNNRKWLITGLYRPPSMSNSEFSKDFIDTFDKASTKYDNILMLGDLNYDMLVNEKSNTLKDACDVCDLTNLVHEPTCHTKGNNPSLIDVVLTNKSSLCMNIRNFNTGISDFFPRTRSRIRKTRFLRDAYPNGTLFMAYNLMLTMFGLVAIFITVITLYIFSMSTYRGGMIKFTAVPT